MVARNYLPFEPPTKEVTMPQTGGADEEIQSCTVRHCLPFGAIFSWLQVEEPKTAQGGAEGRV